MGRRGIVCESSTRRCSDSYSGRVVPTADVAPRHPGPDSVLRLLGLVMWYLLALELLMVDSVPSQCMLPALFTGTGALVMFTQSLKRDNNNNK